GAATRALAIAAAASTAATRATAVAFAVARARLAHERLHAARGLLFVADRQDPALQALGAGHGLLERIGIAVVLPRLALVDEVTDGDRGVVADNDVIAAR